MRPPVISPVANCFVFEKASVESRPNQDKRFSYIPTALLPTPASTWRILRKKLTKFLTTKRSHQVGMAEKPAASRVSGPRAFQNSLEQIVLSIVCSGFPTDRLLGVCVCEVLLLLRSACFLAKSINTFDRKVGPPLNAVFLSPIRCHRPSTVLDIYRSFRQHRHSQTRQTRAPVNLETQFEHRICLSTSAWSAVEAKQATVTTIWTH